MKQIPKGVAYLPHVSIQYLKKKYKRERDSKAALRLLCAIHRKDGRSITEISQILFIPVSTVSDHLRRLHMDEGNLYDKRIQGRPDKLTEEEHSKLIHAISGTPKESNYPSVIWTTKMIKHFIRTKFEKDFSDFGLRKMLRRSGFVRLKPRPSHVKGDPIEQEEFKKNFLKSLISLCKVDMRSSFWTKRDSS